MSLLVCHFDCVLTDAEERSSDDVVMKLDTNEEELDNVFSSSFIAAVSLPHLATTHRDVTPE